MVSLQPYWCRGRSIYITSSCRFGIELESLWSSNDYSMEVKLWQMNIPYLNIRLIKIQSLSWMLYYVGVLGTEVIHPLLNPHINIYHQNQWACNYIARIYCWQGGTYSLIGTHRPSHRLYAWCIHRKRYHMQIQWLWPKTTDLFKWIFKNWTNHCEIYLCSKGSFMVLFKF